MQTAALLQNLINAPETSPASHAAEEAQGGSEDGDEFFMGAAPQTGGGRKEAEDPDTEENRRSMKVLPLRGMNKAERKGGWGIQRSDRRQELNKTLYENLKLKQTVAAKQKMLNSLHETISQQAERCGWIKQMLASSQSSMQRVLGEWQKANEWLSFGTCLEFCVAFGRAVSTQASLAVRKEKDKERLKLLDVFETEDASEVIRKFEDATRVSDSIRHRIGDLSEQLKAVSAEKAGWERKLTEEKERFARLQRKAEETSAVRDRVEALESEGVTGIKSRECRAAQERYYRAGHLVFEACNGLQNLLESLKRADDNETLGSHSLAGLFDSHQNPDMDRAAGLEERGGTARSSRGPESPGSSPSRSHSPGMREGGNDQEGPMRRSEISVLGLCLSLESQVSSAMQLIAAKRPDLQAQLKRFRPRRQRKKDPVAVKIGDQSIVSARAERAARAEGMEVVFAEAEGVEFRSTGALPASDPSFAPARPQTSPGERDHYSSKSLLGGKAGPSAKIRLGRPRSGTLSTLGATFTELPPLFSRSDTNEIEMEFCSAVRTGAKLVNIHSKAVSGGPGAPSSARRDKEKEWVRSQRIASLMASPPPEAGYQGVLENLLADAPFRLRRASDGVVGTGGHRRLSTTGGGGGGTEREREGEDGGVGGDGEDGQGRGSPKGKGNPRYLLPKQSLLPPDFLDWKRELETRGRGFEEKIHQLFVKSSKAASSEEQQGLLTELGMRAASPKTALPEGDGGKEGGQKKWGRGAPRTAPSGGVGGKRGGASPGTALGALRGRPGTEGGRKGGKAGGLGGSLSEAFLERNVRSQPSDAMMAFRGKAKDKLKSSETALALSKEAADETRGSSGADGGGDGRGRSMRRISPYEKAQMAVQRRKQAELLGLIRVCHGLEQKLAVLRRAHVSTVFGGGVAVQSSAALKGKAKGSPVLGLPDSALVEEKPGG
uniref:Uncharacterized protein n=1 Tax=Chromera velia CCMP2878 TaxID=1169474 RepID=A0A0G4FZI4_9ALVE|eukprot:Cvel_19550.t1-p1 / transcript=Cvel_19550.t1 / gene=Cvel_19550 / organism=Chromera_velia_CCMP2878 / gene_product=hypothetical protein / transcript_product=hypothetical protein / location=Cvel_scaffold1694:16261-26801(+) / protein_length=946 / sequence_SO=supercontig / SO=protein_coding / is_pseudo=false